MIRCTQDVGLRNENMHGFIVGSSVAHRDDLNGPKFIVVSISGLLKTDYIQLDSEKNAWEFAKDYTLKT